MGPPLEVHDTAGKILAFHATPTTFHHHTNTLTTKLRMIIVLLAALTLTGGTLWFLVHYRVRIRRRRHSSISSKMCGIPYGKPSSEMMIFESDISIDMLGDDGQSSGTEFEDLSDGGSMETILSPATQMSFDFDKLPGCLKGGILERRGRGYLNCDTSAYYELNSIATGAGPLSGFLEAKKSVVRPVFGFSFQEITPPVGSPLWNRKLDGPRPVCPGPFTQPGKLT